MLENSALLGGFDVEHGLPCLNFGLRVSCLGRWSKSYAKFQQGCGCRGG